VSSILTIRSKGPVVEWSQFHPVTVRGTGSNPVGTAKEKRGKEKSAAVSSSGESVGVEPKDTGSNPVRSW
jgi:hypothetical protein